MTAATSADPIGGAPARTVLGNGLRVLVRSGLPPGAVAVSVHYGGGHRADPTGHPGLAHLVEHLAFRGRGTAATRSRVGAAGATTHPDHTDFFAVAPAAALPELLAAEARRMAGIDPTRAGVAAERRIVAAEIARNVTGRPYGRFPQDALPGLLFGAGSDGYGDPSALEHVPVEVCRAFAERHYRPGNAVLTVDGDVPAAEVLDLVHELFGPLPDPGSPPPPPRLPAPPPDADLTATRLAAGIPLPALAVGHPVPDPAADPAGYAAHVLLGAVLAGAGGLLPARLPAAGLAVEVGGRCGLTGAPWDARDPDALVITVLHPPAAERRRILDTLEVALTEIASGAHGGATLAAAARWRCARLRDLDQLLTRTRRAGANEILHGPAAPPLAPDLAGVADQVPAAAAGLLRGPRGVLHLDPAP